MNPRRRSLLLSLLTLSLDTGCDMPLQGMSLTVRDVFGTGDAGVPDSGGELVLAQWLETTDYWLNADYVTSGGDGTESTAAEDQGSGGSTIAKATAGGPTWFETRYGGKSCLYFGSNKGYSSIGLAEAIVALLAGNPASTPWEAFLAWQPLHHLQNIPFCWSKQSATSRGLICRWGSSTYKPEIYGGTLAGTQSAIAAPAYMDHPVPKISFVQWTGSELYFWEDGVPQAAVAIPWTGNHDCDAFNIGYQLSAANTFSNGFLLRHLAVRAGNSSPSVIQELHHWAGQECFPVNYKAGLGATGVWYIIPTRGQSNGVGFCPGSPAYAFDPTNLYTMGLDGFVREMTAIDGDGTNDASPVLAFQTTAGPSYRAAMGEALRNLGKIPAGGKVLFVPNELISTDSAAWIQGLTDDPPSINTLIGHYKHRTRDACKAPGAKIYRTCTDQWEANCDNGTEAGNLGPQWASVYDEDEAFFAANGIEFEDATDKHLVTEPPDSSAGHGAFKEACRTSLQTTESGRTDMTLVKGPTPTCESNPGLHRIGTENQTHGQALAAAA